MNPASYLAEALALANDTKALRIGPGALTETPAVFHECFGTAVPLVIADTNTFAAAGRRVHSALAAAGLNPSSPFILNQPYAGMAEVQQIQEHISRQPCIPVAVGSGTINDLTKLAASRCGRAYLCVATAASMDGYTAYGASITDQGSKQTFMCPAPKVVVADLAVIAAAPAWLNAAGYADLAAKLTAGADWLLADALGQEALNAPAWQMVQTHLRRWLADPAGLRRGNPEALRHLAEGLLMTGFAMQHCRSSRPASGAEHQFSHLCDMQQLMHEGQPPLHGCKVAIGTLAVTRLYERLLKEPIEHLDLAKALALWPTREQLLQQIDALLPAPDLNKVARAESLAKYADRTVMAERLARLKQVWPDVRTRLQEQLIPSAKLVEMFRRAGVPVESEQIGISRARLCRSHVEAQLIRRRFTVLDVAAWMGWLPEYLEDSQWLEESRQIHENNPTSKY